ncbi:hypothetical protein BpHYR1_029593 [Brachionus plicatilis]|uniref:RNA-directed DNA polymerase from mobile element jockey-like n=1 Tax=Brachionus plicatilis TaxID=10195 RepID=A0A3M7SJZ8_BRAPC|nr:hypothetical protein BpHYR1_029593 [Brachionus plicatilis]
MKFSIEKSCCMIFTKSTREELNLDLKIYGDNLKRQDEIKFLGIRFDSRLTFSPLIDEYKKKTKNQNLILFKHYRSRDLNKLQLLTLLNRLFELSQRYVAAGPSNSVTLVFRLVKEYGRGSESRHKFSSQFLSSLI